MAPKESDYIELAHKRADEKKTHVSFPQLKYPSLRDEGFKDPVQWLMGKAMDDGAEGLWRVHDGIYDLNDFVGRHPGGAEWLDLTKGTDITEAFESHHLNPAVKKVLEKYYVRDAKTPRNSPFTFKEDGFYCTLKAAVFEELKKLPPHIAKRADRMIDLFFTTMLISSALACYSQNYWVSFASYLTASAFLAWTVAASHNYIHRKTNWRMYLFSLSLWSYRDFRISHALSHHLYPNTLMDLEISAFEPVIYWNPRKKPILCHFAVVIEQLLFPFLFIINFVKKFILNFKREGFYTNHYHWHDGLAFVLLLWMWIVSGTTFYKALSMWLWINCTASYIFFTIALNAAHHHPDIFKDGDQVRDENPDWGMFELEAVMDRKEMNASTFMIMAFFGYHSLHHMFPTLDHTLHPYLYPLFLEHCEKYRANFRVTSQLALMIGQVKQTVKTDPNVLKDE